jgi:hypothetical protein
MAKRKPRVAPAQSAPVDLKTRTEIIVLLEQLRDGPVGTVQTPAQRRSMTRPRRR